jgi:hypothetical protein
MDINRNTIQELATELDKRFQIELVEGKILMNGKAPDIASMAAKATTVSQLQIKEALIHVAQVNSHF